MNKVLHSDLVQLHHVIVSTSLTIVSFKRGACPSTVYYNCKVSLQP